MTSSPHSLTQLVTRPTHLLLVRHGETDWNRDRRLQGWLDVPINERGRGQVRETGRVLRDRQGQVPIRLFSSPILRAMESARILADSCLIASTNGAVKVLEGLREFDLGEFSGRYLADLRDDPRWNEYLDDPSSARFPGGETVPEIRSRVVEAVIEILSTGAEPAVAVSHGGVIRVFLAWLLGSSGPAERYLSIANASVSHIVVSPSGIRVLTISTTGALRPIT